MAKSISGTAARTVSALASAALLLCGCVTTTVLQSENPSKNRPPMWTDYWSLPVDVHGTVPGFSQAGLQAMFPQPDLQQFAALGALPVPDAGRHVVLYLNPSRLPPPEARCSDSDDFVPGPQAGQSAYLAGALCNGGSVVTWATARILTSGLTPDQVKQQLGMMQLQLYQALTRGNNHPELVHPGWIYGP